MLVIDRKFSPVNRLGHSSLNLFALICIVSLLQAISVSAADLETVAALRQGGLVLYMRHPKTHADQADTDPLNLDNVKAQRQLTDEGRQMAREIGSAMKEIGVPVAKVIASGFHRATEAAKLLDLAPVETSQDVSEGGLVVSPNENKRRAAALKRLLSTPPVSGGNLIIVAHKPNLLDAAGPDFFDLGEGEIVIFRPLGEKGFKPIARVPDVAAWKALVAAGK